VEQKRAAVGNLSVPFKSLKQNAWAHTPAGKKALGGEKAVKEWESSTNYSKLPTYATAREARKKES
jgi:hypothetical protein